MKKKLEKAFYPHNNLVQSNMKNSYFENICILKLDKFYLQIFYFDKIFVRLVV